MSQYITETGVTGPNLSVEQGAIAAWSLSPLEFPDTDDVAIVRLGSRVLSEPYLQPGAAGVLPPRIEYRTVFMDECEIDGNSIEVVTDMAGLTGLEYLWQVDLLRADQTLKQRWRGTLLVMGALP